MVMQLNGKPWSSAELSQLEEIVNREGNYSEASRVLGRAYTSVETKAHRLGLENDVWGRPRWKVDLTVSELAYLAGLIDGEGTISIFNRLKPYAFRPLIQITNTNKQIIDYIVSLIPVGNVNIGRTNKYGKHKGQNRLKDLYSYRLWRQADIIELLKAVLPYLVGKHEQAEKVLKYCESRRSKAQRAPYTEDEIKIALSFKKSARYEKEMVTYA